MSENLIEKYSSEKVEQTVNLLSNLYLNEEKFAINKINELNLNDFDSCNFLINLQNSVALSFFITLTSNALDKYIDFFNWDKIPLERKKDMLNNFKEIVGFSLKRVEKKMEEIIQEKLTELT